MKSPVACRTLMMLALAVFSLALAAQAGPGAKAIRWETDYNKALSAAKRQKKMLMVDFYADW